MRLLPFVVAVGCGPKAPPADAGDAEAEPAPAAEVAPPVASPRLGDPADYPADGTEITLLEAGAEPRTPLRLEPQVGSVERRRLAMDVEMSMAVADMPVPQMVIPTIVMPMELTVVERAEDMVTVQFTYGTPEVQATDDTPAELKAALDEGLAALAGLAGTVQLSTAGQVVAVELVDGAELPAQLGSLEEQMNSMSVPFPTESVGVGARWQVASARDQNGVRMGQRSTWTLVARDGDAMTLASTVEVVPLDAALDLSTLPPGSEAQLTAFDMSGQGSSSFTGATMFPSTATSSVSSEMGFLVTAMGVEQAMAMSMHMTMTISE